jgi:outer membrane immunogenic protein
MRGYVILLTAASLAFAAQAVAADLPTKKPVPPPPPPVYNWTGFYVGLNAGVAWANHGDIAVTDPVLHGVHQIGLTQANASGFQGGGQAGYNYQTGPFVLGVETDIQGITGGWNINWGKYSNLGLSTGTHGGWFGTTRARVGYAIDRLLFYATGGVAYGGLNSNPLANNSSNVGYAVGGGVEYGFTDHITAKFEAMYLNLNNGSETIVVPHAGHNYTVASTSGNGGGLVRFGVNYRF